MKNLITALIICCGFFFAARAQADVCSTPDNLVTNCGFETGDFTGWLEAPAGGLNVIYGVDTFDAFTGSYGAFLAGFGSFRAGDTEFALIGQSVPTVVGKQYVFTYDWAHNTSSDPTAVPDDFFTAGINGLVIGSSEEVNVGNQSFTQFKVNFFATSASTLVEFEAEDANFVFSLDDVSVVAAPEPTGAALIGSAITGLFLLRRFRKSTSGG